MRRAGGVGLAILVACSSLREAEPADEGGPGNDGGIVKVLDEGGMGGGDTHDARPTDAGKGRPPCPAPCLPEQISTLENLGPLVVDSFNVYFGSANTGVFKCAKTGCNDAPVKLGANKTTRIALAESTLFWGEGDHLVSCPTGGCGGIPNGIALTQLGIDEVITDGTTLAWHAHVGVNEVIRICPATTCAQKLETVTGVTSLHSGMGIADGKVFWTDISTELRYCPLGDCPSPEKLGPASNDFVAFNGVGYWVYEQNVVSCPLAGCDNFPKKIGSSTSPRLPTVDEQDIYWREMTENTVVRCPVTGCNGAPEVIATDVVGVFYGGLALDNEYVYWTSKSGLYRRHK